MPSSTDRILYEIRVTESRLETKLDQLAHLIVQCHKSRSLGGFVAAVHGRRTTMPVNIPVPQLLDTEKILLSVMPRKRNGHVSTDAVVTWTASGDSTIEVGTDPFPFHDPQFNEDVTCPGNFNCYALTPGSSGTGTVTANATDAEGAFEAAEFGPITWAAGQPRSLNASLGSPISDV